MARDSAAGFGLLLVLFAAILIQGTSAGKMTGYVVATVVYIGVLAVSYYRGTLAVRYDPLVFVPAVFLWVVFLVALARHPTTHSAFRAGAYIVFSGLNLFVIPATFTREQFVDALSVVATVVAALAVPMAIPALVFNVGHFGIWGRGSGPILTSIFTNPNYLSALAALGVVGSYGTARTNRRKRLAVVGALVCVVGLVVAQGRAALLGFVGALVLVAAYELGGRRAVIPLVVAGVIAGVGIVWVAVGDVLGARMTQALFTHRAELWQAAFRAIGEQPLLGWGLVDDGPILAAHGGPTPHGKAFSAHNSFLRMFLMTGVVGGVLYLVLCAGTLIRGIEAMGESENRVDAVFVPLLAIILVLGLFDNAPIFGLSYASVLGALVFGFTLRSEYTFDLGGVVSSVSSKVQTRRQPS